MHFQVFYYLCEFLSGQPTAGLVLRAAEATLDIIPVDYVARGIYWASGHAEVAGRILHLCSGPEGAIKIPVLMQQVRAFMRARGAKLPHLYPLPRACFRALLPVIAHFTSPKGQRALRTLPLFLDYLDQPPMFSNAETKQLLTHAGHHCAPSIYVPGDHSALLRPGKSSQRWERGCINRSLRATRMPSAIPVRRATPKGHPYRCSICSLALGRHGAWPYYSRTVTPPSTAAPSSCRTDVSGTGTRGREAYWSIPTLTTPRYNCQNSLHCHKETD